MTDIDKAAERVRRIANGELGVAVYFPEHRGSVYANNTLDRAADMARDDRRTLADAYLTQQPSYAAQAAEIESAWKMIESEFDIEPRAQIEAEAKTNGFKHGLAQAIHTIWKRDAKVTELAAEIAELRARLAAAEKNRDMRSDMIDSDCMAAINTLRLNEGNSVTLICDNPDFGGPNNAIECSGDWTNWQTKRFTGDRLLTSLQSALKAYFAWHGEEWEPTKQLTALHTAAATFEDERPVDEAWLREQGFTDDPDRIRLQLILPIGIEITWWRSDGEISLSDSTNGLEFEHRTRGQLLHLLAALRPGGVK